jgi:ketosteroid isomerase-like protein
MADTRTTELPAVPPPDPELRRLEPLLGTWTSEGHTLNSVLGPGVPVRSTETFRWLDGRYFLVQEYETVFGDEPPQRGVNYWGRDAATGTFQIVFFSNNGPYTEEGNRYVGRVADGRLTFEGPARFEYVLGQYGAIRPSSDGTITVSWWLRGEDGAWKPWMTNTFARARTDRGRAAEIAEIRAILHRWAASVHAGRLEGILAHHAEELVLFDVPPPVLSRGLRAYRDSWVKQFFPWFGGQGIFELGELEVTAGADAAFCHGLVRCRGTTREGRPTEELAVRLTVGLEKRAGSWTIVHEHHSVPST